MRKILILIIFLFGCNRSWFPTYYDEVLFFELKHAGLDSVIVVTPEELSKVDKKLWEESTLTAIVFKDVE